VASPFQFLWGSADRPQAFPIDATSPCPLLAVAKFVHDIMSLNEWSRSK